MTMKMQHDFFQGSMKIKVQGKMIEPFLQACVRRGCVISNIKRVNEHEVIMSIRLSEWKTFRQLRKKYRCKLSILGGRGLPFYYRKITQRKALMAAFMLSVVVVFLLANTLWSIKVEGLTPELEANVEKKLKTYGVSPGKLTIGMDDPNDIQRKLLDDIPDLLWIGVNKKGTSYQLYGVEKTRHDTNKNLRPSDLVAEKKGMIVKTFIEKGRPLVTVNDVVKKGQKLATGQLVEDKDILVHAEGEVIAETWYKVDQNLPMTQVLQLTDGLEVREYQLKIGSLTLPIWGWWKGKGSQFRSENEETNWEWFGWRSPIDLKAIHYYEIDSKKYEQSKDKIQKMGIITARESLNQYLGKEAKVMKEKVLHLREENGKVKLILLFKVHENIAVTKYISQGD
ncbi:sporulation protein YqfD [Halobacillus halophilus]|uniref:Similar to stage IV sporulation protein n=1 Tax=Halobacillus halophilus (strain ATCC 35676 / DSM 2266 / JCM 20832 / KCTC 3685 / LMG 17431 / NBRC 102448 / NCIMB 2269) TaxID=866895 RepID=I0JP38_HALH3|nr:sporulation protein YqfD [Halobacillus halophilus]ASF39946.1 sporulation protein YqfD [Halobacillus halophilus]CCG45908.1 similar to stage IV sporulation protein [Halobacillus halophilus DSM 2266]